MMKQNWRYMVVDKRFPLKCTICGKAIPTDGEPCGDVLHYPDDLSEEEYHDLKAAWAVDPYADLIVCNGCMSSGKVWDSSRRESRTVPSEGTGKSALA
jgi:hypothetical protein